MNLKQPARKKHAVLLIFNKDSYGDAVHSGVIWTSKPSKIAPHDNQFFVRNFLKLNFRPKLFYLNIIPMTLNLRILCLTSIIKYMFMVEI